MSFHTAIMPPKGMMTAKAIRIMALREIFPSLHYISNDDTVTN
jgi:hypothetical protein